MPRGRFVVLVLFVALLIGAPVARGTDTGPALSVPTATLAKALHCPATFKDDKHEPVLLVHGTFTDDKAEWSWSYVPALARLGFDVCTVTFPDHSMGDMQIQAEYVVYAVRQIVARTGEKVGMIGGSQGTLHPRWAVKWWPDVRDDVEDLIQLAAPNHGTIVATLGTKTGRCFASCWQMADTSNYIKALNTGDETPGDISYTSIYTLTDELVEPQVPVSTSLLDGASNIQVQSLCPGRPTDHVAISTSDAVGFALAVDAITHPGPADAKRFDIATCLQTYPAGANPADLFTSGGGAGFQGDYIDHEPPLRAYAKAGTSTTSSPTTSTTQTTGTDDGGSSDGGSTVAATTSSREPISRSGEIPVGGVNVLRYVALAISLIAVGLTLAQVSVARDGTSAHVRLRRRVGRDRDRRRTHVVRDGA